MTSTPEEDVDAPIQVNYDVIEDDSNRWIDYIPKNYPLNTTHKILVFPPLNGLHAMDFYARYLAYRNLRVRIIQYTGQNVRSTAFMENDTATVDLWHQEVVHAWREYLDDDLPVSAMCYSVGGPLLVRLMRSHETKFRSVLALAPALAMTRFVSFGLAVYSVVSIPFGQGARIFPSSVPSDLRAHDYVSVATLRKPGEILEKIRKGIEEQEGEEKKVFVVPWTVVADMADSKVDGSMLASRFQEFGFNDVKICEIEGVGHDYLFYHEDDFDPGVKTIFDKWIVELTTKP